MSNRPNQSEPAEFLLVKGGYESDQLSCQFGFPRRQRAAVIVRLGTKLTRSDIGECHTVHKS